VVLAQDGGDRLPGARAVLTDGLRRREVGFGSGSSGASATLTAGEPFTLDAPAADYLEPSWSGRLTVELRDDSDRVDVCVSDDGIGLPEGFDPASGGGLGMRIVTALVRQVRGTLTIRSAEPGAEFVISVPLTTSI